MARNCGAGLQLPYIQMIFRQGQDQDSLSKCIFGHRVGKKGCLYRELRLGRCVDSEPFKPAPETDCRDMAQAPGVRRRLSAVLHPGKDGDIIRMQSDKEVLQQVLQLSFLHLVSRTACIPDACLMSVLQGTLT